MQYNGFTPDERAIKLHQRSFVRRESSVWGFTAVLANIFITIIILLINSSAASLGINLNNAITELIMQLVLSVLMMTLPFIIAASYKSLCVKSLVSLKHVPAGLFMPLVMVGLGGAMLSNIMTSYFVATLNAFELYPETVEIAIPNGVGGTLLFFFTYSVVPAIFEEFAYRGIVLGALRRYGNGFAIIASSILFGLMHGNLVQIPFTVALGCVMGYITVISDSIWPSVAVHFFNNFLSCVQQLATERLNEQAGSIIVLTIISSVCILGIIGFAILCRKYKHPFAPIHETAPIEFKDATVGFLSSGGTIAAYIVFGGNAIVSMLFNGA